MKYLAVFIACAAFVSPAAHGQGAIGTVERGVYHCELPGDATGSAGIDQPDLSFTIKSASRYSTSEGRGTYLRRGDILTFTSGPRKGERFVVVSPNFVRILENGEAGRLRCVRARS